MMLADIAIRMLLVAIFKVLEMINYKKKKKVLEMILSTNFSGFSPDKKIQLLLFIYLFLS